MAYREDAEVIVLLGCIQEPDAKKARARYLKALENEDFNDRDIYDLIEDRVSDALLQKDPEVEIEIQIALPMLLMLKKGIKRTRGGQRKTQQEERRQRTLVAIGRRIKAKLIGDGVSATQAHLQAAEEAANEGKKHGLDIAAGYLEREMQKVDR